MSVGYTIIVTRIMSYQCLCLNTKLILLLRIILQIARPFVPMFNGKSTGENYLVLSLPSTHCL